MWITKLKLKHEDCPIVNRCVKFNILVLSYPSTWYEKNGKRFATTTCYFQSNDESQKKKFIEDLKADRRITNLEVSGDVFTYEINLGKEGEHVMLYHNKNIIFVKPAVNHYDGHEYWEVACWKREELEKFIKELKAHMDVCEILKLENSPLTDIYFPNVMPKLSKSQKEALEIAYINGYYSYPRKVTLEQLAKIAKKGISTFQEHLRKAELKLLPVIIEYQIKNK
ncbi:helix-turn-helix domain-containing protein [Candidatus Woesearchaeota archaeon]|nr:helix-turn-helix domain-containing protein [Candidatus Woesearchaeota archaeon]